ncbi:helix-turn-helix domain-containing protein [Gorillibacterium timonense]|uniref:helix-turn-helix domain-containing protein n=1 Tax=Gorillibacterium timonense TaxID=1689269 RepID=UPI00071D1248|nr:AraC family transcriptional regulator [Gorillibacterium timonense]
MATDMPSGTFGFRFTSSDRLALCNLFAVGRDRVQDPAYRWDGETRTDGPLLLFQYTLDGEGVFENESGIYRIGPGQAIMAQIPGPHRYYFPEDGTHWSFLFLLMRPDLIQPNWEDSLRRLGEAPFLPHTSCPIRLLQHIWDEAHGARIIEPYTASSYVYQFVSELCRYASAPQGNNRLWPEKIRLAVEYIESHYSRMISLDQLSERLGLSKYHLLRVFTETVGVSPNHYLNRVRIEAAMRLLRETDWSVERIAEQVGYSGGSYFIKVFRNLTGLTPGNFRSGEGTLTYSRLFFD